MNDRENRCRFRFIVEDKNEISSSTSVPSGDARPPRLSARLSARFGCRVGDQSPGRPPLVTLGQVLGDRQAVGPDEQQAVAVFEPLHVVAGAEPGPMPDLLPLVRVEPAGAERAAQFGPVPGQALEHRLGHLGVGMEGRAGLPRRNARRIAASARRPRSRVRRPSRTSGSMPQGLGSGSHFPFEECETGSIGLDKTPGDSPTSGS